MESFASLGLSEAIVRAVADKGYTQPTPIQLEAIPAILAGHDLMAGAQTGTGKTAGFTLPILQLLGSRPPVHPGARIRVLVLTPTRELAAQVEESVRTYGRHAKTSSMTLFGGVGINPQIERLRDPVDVVVATPGRLLDHVGQGTISLDGIEILVLDEADRMLDMGFIRDIRRILALLPAKRQNLLFSATFSDEIRSLADGLLRQPIQIQVSPVNATADAVRQRAYAVDRDRKRELLAHLIQSNGWSQVLVFTRTKHGANRLAQQLAQAEIPALAIHGNKSQSARTRALAEFKSGELRVLVATDIAARGIDIKELPHVVNYDLPNVPEDYVHRIGRTGRAGSDGEALSLVCVDDAVLHREIERFTANALPLEILAGFEPDPYAKPEPIKGVRGAGRGNAPAAGRGNPRGPRRAPPAPAVNAGEASAAGTQPAELAAGAASAEGEAGAPAGNANAPRSGRSSRRRRGRGRGGEGAQRQDAQPGQAQGQPRNGNQKPQRSQGTRNADPAARAEARRTRYENGGQPLDNANRSAASLATGRSERPGKGHYTSGGKLRRGVSPLVALDSNSTHRPAPSEIVAILQGKRPTAIFDGIPEEDRRELAQNRGQAARPAGGGNANGGNNGAGGKSRSRNRSRSQRGGNGGGARPAAERPLHERFPGLPRDEE